MPQSRLQYLFNSYIGRLQSKGASALYTLFESYAPGLDKKWSDLKPGEKESLGKSGVAKKLGLDTKIRTASRSSRRHDSRGSDGDRTDEDDGEAYEYPSLRAEFEKWQRERYSEARTAFDTMLSENAFVEFWGRVGKMGVVDDEEKQRLGKTVFADETAGSTAAAVDPEDLLAEGEGGGGKADLQALAKGVDVKEVTRVLRGDKRFIVFDYMPAEREKWVAVSLFIFYRCFIFSTELLLERFGARENLLTNSIGSFTSVDGTKGIGTYRLVA
jgi:transcription elongation regulator 1